MSKLVHKPQGEARGDAELVASEEILDDLEKPKRRKKSKLPTVWPGRERASKVVEEGVSVDWGIS
jgi:hypothetical protein